jgi:hypothetical protein
MAACLSIVPVPSVIADLVQKIEQVNRTGDDLFFADFEFVLLPERRDIAGMTAWHLPVEIAVVRLDGQVAIDTPIKYNQPISEILAGDPSAEGGRTWGTMQRIYGRGEETSGMTWDEIRQTLLDAGMNRNNCLMEWSRSGTDHKFIRMIMGEDTPSNPMWLIPYWRAIQDFPAWRYHTFIPLFAQIPNFRSLPTKLSSIASCSLM